MNKLKLPLVLIFLVSVFIGCNSEDDDEYSSEIYTIEDLSLLHNNSSKEWELEGYYVNYDNWISQQNDCLIDDRYIFKVESEVEVINGDVNCYYGDSEIAEAKYTFYEEEGTIRLTMIRGEISDDIIKSTFFTLKLIELTEDRMVFSSGNKGDYETALIFVKK